MSSPWSIIGIIVLHLSVQIRSIILQSDQLDIWPSQCQKLGLTAVEKARPSKYTEIKTPLKAAFTLRVDFSKLRWVQKSQRRTDDFPMLEENDCWIFRAGRKWIFPARRRPFAPPYKANSGPPVIFAFAHHPVRGLRKYEKERKLCDGNKIRKENEITYSLLGQIDYTKNMKKWSHSLDKISKGHKKAAKSDQWLISDGIGDRGPCL